MHAYLIEHANNADFMQKTKYACMHLIKYACIYILTSVNTIINQKKYACI